MMKIKFKLCHLTQVILKENKIVKNKKMIIKNKKIHKIKFKLMGFKEFQIKKMNITLTQF